ncbi:MAG: hypothetical protein ABWY00_10515, partial [Dongiaceae bacterium]
MMTPFAIFTPMRATDTFDGTSPSPLWGEGWGEGQIKLADTASALIRGLPVKPGNDKRVDVGSVRRHKQRRPPTIKTATPGLDPGSMADAAPSIET